MKKDRTEICRIISHMLDNPDEHGIYPTSTAYDQLESYIDGARAEVLGWAYMDACLQLDQGDDPRLSEVPDMLNRMSAELDGEEEDHGE